MITCPRHENAKIASLESKFRADWNKNCPFCEIERVRYLLASIQDASGEANASEICMRLHAIPDIVKERDAAEEAVKQQAARISELEARAHQLPDDFLLQLNRAINESGIPMEACLRDRFETYIKACRERNGIAKDLRYLCIVLDIAIDERIGPLNSIRTAFEQLRSNFLQARKEVESSMKAIRDIDPSAQFDGTLSSYIWNLSCNFQKRLNKLQQEISASRPKKESLAKLPAAG